MEIPQGTWSRWPFDGKGHLDIGALQRHFVAASSCGICDRTSRWGFEIVQKPLVAGVPILASVSAPSSLAVRMARDGGLTLVGFLRDRRFVVYSHPNRVASNPD